MTRAFVGETIGLLLGCLLGLLGMDPLEPLSTARWVADLFPAIWPGRGELGPAGLALAGFSRGLRLVLVAAALTTVHLMG